VRSAGARDLAAVAVFCGSNTGQGDAYWQGGAALGRAIGERGLTLVYGGTHKGLMGALTDACLEAGGSLHVNRPRLAAPVARPLKTLGSTAKSS